jgi:PAS domain S-box-containing protein
MRTPLEPGKRIRRLLPWVIMVPIVLGWLHLRGQEAGIYSPAVGSALRTLTEILLLAIGLRWVLRTVAAQEQQRVARQLTEQKQALAALEESSRVLQAISATTADVLFSKDREGRLTYANPAALALIGLPLEQVIGRTDLEFLQDKTAARRVMANDARIMASGRAEDVEEVVPRPDGTRRTWFSRKMPYLDGSGNVAGLLGVSRDITERVQAEEEARLAHARLEAVIASISDGLLVMDRQWRYTYFSERAAEILGVKREDMLGRVVWDLFPQARETKFYEYYHQAVETGEPQRFEEFYPAPLNQWLECHCNAGPEGLTVYFRDVTERKRAESALRQSEEQRRSVLEAMSEGLMLFDAGANLIYQNPASLRIHGFDPDDPGQIGREKLPGTWKAWDQTGAEISFEQWPVSRVFRGERFQDQVLRVIRVETDQEFYGSYNGSPIFGADGALILGFITIRDITAQTRAEQEIQRAAEQLRRNQETFIHLIQNNPFGICVVDADLTLVQVSLGARKVFEKVDPLLGRDYAEVLRTVWAEPFASEAIARFRHTLNTGEPYSSPATVEQRRDRADVEAYDWRIERITLPDGRHGVVSYFYDLSERQRWEARLAETKRRVDAALIAGEVGTFDWDIAGARVRGDANFERMFGLELDEDRAAPLANYVHVMHPDDQERVRARIALTVDTGVDYEVEYRVISGGRTRWLLVRARPERDASGRVVRAAGVCLDVTEQKRAEAALRENEQRLRQMGEAMPQIVWVSGPDGGVQYFNRRWYEFSGVAEGSSNGDAWAAVLHPEDQARTWAIWRQSVETGEPYEIEYRLRRSDGIYQWFLGRALPVKDAGGRVVTWFGTCTDVHGARIAREELQAAKETAEAASRAKDDLLAAVSHELRTPLNPILAITTGLEHRTDLPGDLRDDLATIRRNVEQEARIIDDLLNLTRLQRNKIELRQEEADLDALARNVVAQFVAQAKRQGVTLELSLHAGPRHAWVDTGRMQQVLSNLLDNALKFTSSGGRVIVSTQPLPDGGMQLEVADTGVGIDAAVLPKLFSPFEQGGPLVARRYGGLGLGLAIIKGIVELHGGRITAHSAGSNRGASFRVSLPPRPPGSTPETLVARRPEPSAASETCRRILLVDDHRDTLKIMSRLLKSLGYTVTTASSVGEAMEQAGRQTFDLLVSDIGLPDGSGLDIMRALRERGAIRGIAMSGFGQDEDIRRSRSAGFDAHLVKPVNLNLLNQTIQQLVC